MSESGFDGREGGSRSDVSGRESSKVDWRDPRSLDVCVIGSGAMGGLLGGRLANAGANVSLIDEGSHREALSENGLTLIEAAGGRTAIQDLTVRADTTGQGPQDLVILGVKAYDLPTVAPMVPRVVGPDTVVLPVQNGIPWWYFHRFGGDLEGRRIAAADPDGRLERHVDADRVVGCVPFAAGAVVEPGVVRHAEGEWFPVGELDGAESRRVRGVAELLERAGLRSRVLTDVRSELWLKALGNLSFNPISALTRSTLGEICTERRTRELVRRLMEEAKAVAEALGVSFRRSIDDRIDGAEAVGDHRTSMLQDAERGNRLEHEALLGTVIELADLTDRSVPTIETVYGLTKLLDETGRSV